MSRKIRILLVDDHELVRESLRRSLQPDFRVVAAVGSGDEVFPALVAQPADVVLLDLGLPGKSGLEVIVDLRRQAPDVKVLVLSMHTDPVLVESSLQSGAHGFVPKNATLVELGTAIRTVTAGGRYVSSRLPRRADRPADGAERLGIVSLTPRQRQIVSLLGEGKSTAEIAAALSLSPNTVTFHRARIRKALGISTEIGLSRFAFIARLSEESSPREA